VVSSSATGLGHPMASIYEGNPTPLLLQGSHDYTPIDRWLNSAFSGFSIITGGNA